MKLRITLFANTFLLIAILILYTVHATAIFLKNEHKHAFTDSNLLKATLRSFIAKSDSGIYADLIPYYDSGFISIRVVDEGQFIKMDYKQMVGFWQTQINNQQAKSSFNHRSITNGQTTIHYMEILGDTAYIILTRIKDLGKGPEPMFYNLIWINKNNKWYLFREIVHQRTMPSFH